jgi:hypothetical protein
MSVPKECNSSDNRNGETFKVQRSGDRICRMWEMKVTNIPVIVGALGLIKKGMHGE